MVIFLQVIPGQAMAEKRRANRYDISAPVHVCVSLAGKLEFHIGQIRNISRTGILFQAPLHVELGTNLELAFCLPEERRAAGCVMARGSCRVVRSAEVGGQGEKVFGIAVEIDRIEYFRAEPPPSDEGAAHVFPERRAEKVK